MDLWAAIPTSGFTGFLKKANDPQEIQRGAERVIGGKKTNVSFYEPYLCWPLLSVIIGK